MNALNFDVGPADAYVSLPETESLYVDAAPVGWAGGLGDSPEEERALASGRTLTRHARCVA